MVILQQLKYFLLGSMLSMGTQILHSPYKAIKKISGKKKACPSTQQIKKILKSISLFTQNRKIQLWKPFYSPASAPVFALWAIPGTAEEQRKAGNSLPVLKNITITKILISCISAALMKVPIQKTIFAHHVATPGLRSFT